MPAPTSLDEMQFDDPTEELFFAIRFSENPGFSGNFVEMVGGAPGTAMDSNHNDWTNDDPNDAVDGALELWEGVVRDGSLGATSVDPPPIETIEPGGYYDTRATIRLQDGDVQYDEWGNNISGSLGGAVTEKSFYNAALQMDVTVQEIDVGMLMANGDWPPNGLIYLRSCLTRSQRIDVAKFPRVKNRSWISRRCHGMQTSLRFSISANILIAPSGLTMPCA